MKINRKEFLDKLKTILCGTSKRESLEQDNCFIFSEDLIIAFNGEVFAACQFEFDHEFAVNAFDLVRILGRVTDEEVRIEFKNNQLKVFGKNKRAGLRTQNEILLPYTDVTRPVRMKRIKKDFLQNVQTAAKICSADTGNYRTSHVHVTRKVIEATDRYRIYRLQIDTGVDEIMIPADSVLKIGKMEATHIEDYNGWIWIKDDNKKIMVALCCCEGSYFSPDLMNKILRMEEPQTIHFPEGMIDAIDRSMVMTGNDSLKMAQIHLKPSSLCIRTQKDSGWYEEKQRVKYRGEEMKIKIGLSLLKDILGKTQECQLAENKIKMQKDNMEFVIALEG